MSYDTAFWQLRVTYNPDNGLFTWKERPVSDFPTPHGKKVFDARFVGKTCGGRMADGYVLLKAQVATPDGGQRVCALAHRVAWFLTGGIIPKSLEIDHIDGNPQNNKLSNLRLVTSQQNSFNQKVRCTNALACKGVCIKGNRFIAQIAGAHIGSYKTLNQACEAYAAVAQELHGVFQRKSQ